MKKNYAPVLAHVLDLRAWPMVVAASDVSWLLWIEQDGQSNRADRLFAGRVKLQDDPIALAYTVLYDAVQKLESALDGGVPGRLF